jgi:hypothetical protein
VAQQLGGSLGLGILVTVFAAASRVTPPTAAVTAGHTVAQWQLAHAVSRALTGSAIFLALALVVVTVVMRQPVEAEADDPRGVVIDPSLEVIDLAAD